MHFKLQYFKVKFKRFHQFHNKSSSSVMRQATAKNLQVNYIETNNCRCKCRNDLKSRLECCDKYGTLPFNFSRMKIWIESTERVVSILHSCERVLPSLEFTPMMSISHTIISRRLVLSHLISKNFISSHFVSKFETKHS